MHTLIRALAIPAVGLMLTTAVAANDFQAAGAGGDARSSDVCLNGGSLVGFSYRSGLWMDQIRIVCAKLKPNKTWDSVNYIGPARGGTGGGPGQALCPKNTVLFGVNFSMTTGNRQVRHIQLKCAPPDALRDIATTSVDFGGPAQSSNNGPLHPVQNCASNQAVVSLRTNFGKHVNGLGIVCGRL